MHYNEAKLIKKLEELGIGRPSTYASIISKIQDRKYVLKENVSGKKIDVLSYKLKNNKVTHKTVSKIFGNENNKLILQPLGRMVIEYLIKDYFSFVYFYTIIVYFFTIFKIQVIIVV